ncbi:MAG: type III polyketide synthase [Candidatus Zixiibacteriota bacterium]
MRPNHPKLIDVRAQAPEYLYQQGALKKFAGDFFRGKLDDLDRLLNVFDSAGIDNRPLAVPIEWFAEEKSFQEKNDTYIERALELSSAAINTLLEKNDLEPGNIDHLLFVSTTGLATPSLDARLIGKLGMRPDTRRTPIWGLGCAGGALGLTQAYDILIGKPEALALLVNVELCSLTFQFRDFSKGNLVATALFSDGVTAALLVGANSTLAGPQIIAAGERLWPDTLDIMGWNVSNEGMQVVFSQRIPQIVREKMKDCLSDFLAANGLTLEKINRFLIHPGGRRVIEAYCEALDLPPRSLALSCEVLRKYGNCSSASVMIVLEEFLRRGDSQQGDLALVSALGPGFSAGSALLRM